MNLVKADYSGHRISFSEADAWFNATEAAAFYGKKPIEWLRIQETEKYIEALCEFHKVGVAHFVKTKRGTKSPGTWFHPLLAVPFARWCDVMFAIWCDDQINKILRGNHPHFDWKKMRSEAASSFKVMNEALRLVRDAQDKKTEGYHYSNEARLVNYALAGKSAALNRESLSGEELALLAKLETRNAVLIAQGFDYQTRKATLRIFAAEALSGQAELKLAAIAA